MKALVASLALSLFASLAAADTLTFTPSPADLNDLDHHYLYTWRVNNVSLGGNVVTGATLTLENIRNWDSNPNRLFVHLFDNAVYGGVRGFLDDKPSNAPVTTIRDDFVDTRWHNGRNALGQSAPWVIGPGTGDVLLFDRSFGTSAQTYVYTFTADEIAYLNSFILNGRNFALGLDSDCHYFNDGIKLTLTTGSAPVPEPGTLALLGGTAVAAWFGRRRLRAR
jgi:hypothetical protein